LIFCGIGQSGKSVAAYSSWQPRTIELSLGTLGRGGIISIGPSVILRYSWRKDWRM
jgi:hypothetical protein